MRCTTGGPSAGAAVSRCPVPGCLSGRCASLIRVPGSWCLLGVGIPYCAGGFCAEAVGPALGEFGYAALDPASTPLVALCLLGALHFAPSEEVARNISLGCPAEPDLAPAPVLAGGDVHVVRSLLHHPGHLVGGGVGLCPLRLLVVGVALDVAPELRHHRLQSLRPLENGHAFLVGSGRGSAPPYHQI